MRRPGITDYPVTETIEIGSLDMAGLSDIAKKHMDAAVAEAAETGYPPDDIARTMLSFVILVMREHKEPKDIIDELQYVADNLDPDREYTFMRP